MDNLIKKKKETAEISLLSSNVITPYLEACTNFFPVLSDFIHVRGTYLRGKSNDIKYM